MAQTPNVIELYEAAVQHMLPTMEAIKAEQLAEATPCSEWNVQALILQIIKTTGFVQGIIRGNNTVDTGDVGGPLPQEGAGEAFVTGAKEVSRAARRCTTAAEESCTTGTMRKD